MSCSGRSCATNFFLAHIGCCAECLRTVEPDAAVPTACLIVYSSGQKNRLHCQAALQSSEWFLQLTFQQACEALHN